MISRLRWGRVLRGFAVAVLVLVAGLAAFVQIQQHILRWRAERLLADIREIQMGKSTWADAQRLMVKWGAWGSYTGACSSQRCNYRVTMQDPFRGMQAYVYDEQGFRILRDQRRCCGWFKPIYHLLGGRFAVVIGLIQVRNGIIWTKSFVVEIATSPDVYKPHNDSAMGSEPLVADAEGVTHFQSQFEISPSHPEYHVYAGGCTGCVLASSLFTPRVGAETMDKLLDINLACLTRWKECMKQEEIMPQVYRLAKSEEGIPPAPWLYDESCHEPLELAVRDSRFAALAEVASVRVVRHGKETARVASFRSIASLKNDGYVGPLLFRDELAMRSTTILPGGVPASSLRRGDKILLLYGSRPDENDVATHVTFPCGIIPRSPENLAAFERGIALDAVPDRY